MSTTSTVPTLTPANGGPPHGEDSRDTPHSPPLTSADRVSKKPHLHADGDGQDSEDHQMEDEEELQQQPQQQQQLPVPQVLPLPVPVEHFTGQAAGPQQGAAQPIRTMPTEDLPQPLTRQAFNPYTMPYVAAFDDTTMAIAVRGENPHLLSTRNGGAIELPLPPHPVFPDTDFVHTHFATHKVFANVLRDQAEAVKAAGARALALVAHGGGQAMYKQTPEVATVVQTYIKGFAFQSNNNEGFDVKVYTPIPNKEDDGKPFAPPFAMFVKLPENADAIRTFLLQQEIFTVSPMLSFTAVTTDNPQASWKVLVITGDAIVPGATHRYVENQKQVLLRAIKQALERREVVSHFENLTSQLARANWGLTGTRKAIMNTALDTFSLEPATAEDAHGVAVPAYVLLAKPPAYEQTELEDWKAIVASRKSIWVGMDRFDVNAARVDCKLCKSDIHRTADCPIATTEGWAGVTPETLALPAAMQGGAGRGIGTRDGAARVDTEDMAAEAADVVVEEVEDAAAEEDAGATLARGRST
ncbi:hypothetical protein C8Q80DRAFT_1273595 [Daedaleopsis nitida]|nr:hypothetical protein C8Q80DRAFT_1273595 [Daedaleopsis nitida]